MIAGTPDASGANGIPPPPLLPHPPSGPSTAGQANPPQGLFAWYAPGFSDALGDRLLLFDNTDGRPLELLRLRPELAQVADFEASLRERSLELAAFADSRFARVYRVDWLPEPGGGLAIVSEHVEGRRLSEVLARARERRGLLTPDLTLALLHDLVSAVAALHRQGRDIAHGALGPERLVVTPRGRVLVTEYILGLALGRLGAASPAIARDLCLEVARGEAACDQRGDVRQIGATALALLLARTPTNRDVKAQLDEAGARARLCGWDESRWSAFRPWLDRALQVDGSEGFVNAIDARLAFEQIAARQLAIGAGGTAIARFLADCTSDSAAGQPGLDVAEDGDADAPVVRDLVKPGAGTAAGSAAQAPATGTELLAFPSEAALAREGTGQGSASAETRAHSMARGGAIARLMRGVPRAWLMGGLALLVVIEGVYIGSRVTGARNSASPTVGTLRLESNPVHASVSIDGKPSGVTPTVVRLPAGRHAVDLSIGSRRRRITLTLEAGTTSSQFVDLPPEVSGVGDIDVRSEPAGARVVVDGQLRGTTPLLLKGIAVGAHDVRVESRGRAASQSVQVEEAGTANLFVPFAGGNAPAPGWLSITSPLELQVYEDDQLLGTSESERIMLPAGRHEISLVNQAAGFRTIREVTVPVGQTEEVEIALPNGALDINATPWAEVSIDGQKVGETPLSGVAARLGRHRVTFRHPTLGERTVECVVTVGQAARVSVDLRK